MYAKRLHLSLNCCSVYINWRLLSSSISLSERVHKVRTMYNFCSIYINWRPLLSSNRFKTRLCKPDGFIRQFFFSGFYILELGVVFIIHNSNNFITYGQCISNNFLCHWIYIQIWCFNKWRVEHSINYDPWKILKS